MYSKITSPFLICALEQIHLVHYLLYVQFWCEIGIGLELSLIAGYYLVEFQKGYLYVPHVLRFDAFDRHLMLLEIQQFFGSVIFLRLSEILS